MSKKFSRVDANQKQLVKAFRDLGWTVLHLHEIGKGCPDICASKCIGETGVNILAEIKDGSLPPSKRRLTPDEIKFHDEWQGPLYIVQTIDDVIAIDKVYTKLLQTV